MFDSDEDDDFAKINKKAPKKSRTLPTTSEDDCAASSKLRERYRFNLHAQHFQNTSNLGAVFCSSE